MFFNHTLILYPVHPVCAIMYRSCILYLFCIFNQTVVFQRKIKKTDKTRSVSLDIFILVSCIFPFQEFIIGTDFTQYTFLLNFDDAVCNGIHKLMVVGCKQQNAFEFD